MDQIIAIFSATKALNGTSQHVLDNAAFKMDDLLLLSKNFLKPVVKED